MEKEYKGVYLHKNNDYMYYGSLATFESLGISYTNFLGVTIGDWGSCLSPPIAFATQSDICVMSNYEQTIGRIKIIIIYRD